MCGINLVLNYPRQGKVAIQKMMQATQHRGPDHSAWVEAGPGVYLAGNRLKILDLQDKANQPLLTEDESRLLVWNGALYNYQDLKNELLDQKITFKSQSDGEVLLHWLGLHGSKGIPKLKGMFSLIFVDKVKKMVVVARDPFGMKPLYYYHSGNQWLLSSEAIGITASSLVVPRLDRKQYLPYFFSRHSLPEGSFYEEVRQLVPGKVIRLDFEGNKLEDFMLEIQKKEILLPGKNEFRELLTDSVLKHFHADVPVGMILSGGADSSLLYHTWYKESGVPLPTFTAVFEAKYSKAYPDHKFAATLANKYYGYHQEVLIHPENILDNWEEYIRTLDQPVGDSASILTWMIGKKAREQVKVLISGAGADELFSGYNRHIAFQYYLKNPGLFNFLTKFKAYFKFLPRAHNKFLQSIGGSPADTYLNFSSLQPIPEDLKTTLLSLYPSELSPYKAALEWDRTYYLVNDILKVHDNATMTHGIEGRCPYLDWPLVTLSSNLNEKQHLSLRPKAWIKDILEEEGLGTIARRPKLGFGLPLLEWFRDYPKFRNQVFSTIKEFEGSSGIDFPEEMRILAKNPAFHVEHSFLQLWNLFVLASWKRYRGL